MPPKRENDQTPLPLVRKSARHEVPSTPPDFLQPLISKDKVRSWSNLTNPRSPLSSSENPIFQKLNSSLDALNDPSSSKDLARFIPSQLANQDAFKGIGLYNKTGTNQYDSKEKELSMHIPPQIATNPIIPLIHEGTHALDFLRMNTYQKPTFDFLAKHYKDQPFDPSYGNYANPIPGQITQSPSSSSTTQLLPQQTQTGANPIIQGRGST